MFNRIGLLRFTSARVLVASIALSMLLGLEHGYGARP